MGCNIKCVLKERNFALMLQQLLLNKGAASLLLFK